jgi:2-polyprenyl-6-methoxyphenol hydroxylase-like FAD-dependent oxidoreductase
VIFTIPNYLKLDRLWMMHYVPKRMGAIMQYGSGKHTRALLMFSSPKMDYDHRDVEQQKNIVRKMFVEEPGWEFPRLLEEMRGASDFYFDDVSQIRMDRWSNGRVALVGDAACGPTLITGQGTSMALVGAYVLAGELASAGGDYRTAFARYEQECRRYMGSDRGTERAAACDACCALRLAARGFDGRHHSEGGQRDYRQRLPETAVK